MSIDLTTYEFDTPAEFGVPTDPVLLQEAKDRGFYRTCTRFNLLFLYFMLHGGRLNFKENVEYDFMVRATAYLKALKRSAQPAQDEKEAVCAMLLSELVKGEGEE